MEYNSLKGELILHTIPPINQGNKSLRVLGEGPVSYQVVGRVIAYQAKDR